MHTSERTSSSIYPLGNATCASAEPADALPETPADTPPAPPNPLAGLSGQARRKASIQLRNAEIRRRFDELYDVNRLRMDDVLAQLCREYHLAPLTIERILHNQ